MALARGIDLVLLAHHRRDQAETFLLQALRGGGVAGLSAMPARVRREGVTWARPWLEMPREAIEAYVRRHRLAYVDDDSNADARFARNRLRLEVWPALEAAFPAAEASLAAAARWAQEATAALAEWAEVDLAAICDEASLDIAAWRAPLAGAAEQPLARLAAAVDGSGAGREPGRAAAARGSGPRIDALADRCRRVAQLSRPSPVRAAVRCRHPRRGRRPARRRRRPTTIDLSRPGIHELAGWDGAIEVRPVSAGGIAASLAAPPGGARASARRPVPGRRRPAAAQPQAAVPGGRPARLAARRARCSAATACRCSSPGSASMPAPWRRRGSRSWPWPGCRADRIVGSLFIGRLRPPLRETACSRRQQAPSSWH